MFRKGRYTGSVEIHAPLDSGDGDFGAAIDLLNVVTGHSPSFP